MLIIDRHPNGMRVYIFGQRLHHGASGIIGLLGAGLLRQRVGAMVALAVIAHDRHDWRVWFARDVYVRVRTPELDVTQPD